MVDNDNSGGVFKNWHNVQLVNLSKPLRNDIITLMNLPRFPDHITGPDIFKLERIAGKYNVQTKDKNLKDVRTFYRVEGDVEEKIDKRLREELKPRDPFVEMMKDADVKMNEGDINNQV